jgi:predicted amidohydrolase YtcJ
LKKQEAMNRFPTILLALVVFSSPAPAAEPPADLLLLNARVWTGNPLQPEAEAVAIRGERIVGVGKAADVQALRGPKTQTRDLGGRRVVSGFFDSHVHILGAGLQLSRVYLKDCKDEEEFGKRLRAFDAKLPAGRWLVGGDWDHDRALGGRLPTAALLDKYVPDRPVFLSRYDGHMGVANTRALKLAGITAQTADPSGGVIYRQKDSQEPTGLLRNNAMGLVKRLLPDVHPDEIQEAVQAALAELARNGVTSVQDLDGSGAATRGRLWALYQQLAANGKLTCRIDQRWPLAAWQEAAKVQDDPQTAAWVRRGGVKGFADGSLGSSTARFFQPYLNEPGNTGIFVTSPTRLKELIQAADQAGLPVTVHAIGDRANAEMLDIYAAVAQENGPRDRRFRIEHAQHLRPADVPRFRQLGVIPSLQPYHIADDGRFAEGRIGKDRCASSYANRSLLDAGARLAFGSDWPVAPVNPLLGLDAAITRRPLDGKYLDGWFPAQKISIAEALSAYTLGAAYAAFTDKDRGSLEVGKLADLVVLSRDILAPAEADRIGEAEVLLTLVGGRVAFEAAKERWEKQD